MSERRAEMVPPAYGFGGRIDSLPDHVRSNAAQFIAMKRNERFPKSDYGDDSRIEFLAAAWLEYWLA